MTMTGLFLMAIGIGGALANLQARSLPLACLINLIFTAGFALVHFCEGVH